MTANVATVVCSVVLLSACLAGLARSRPLDEPLTGRIEVKVLHRDHFLSPFHDPELSYSMADRAVRAVRRSQATSQRLAKLQKCRGEPASSHWPVEAPVYAGEYEYVMKGLLGTPPMNFSAIVDTGSDLIWLQCMQCQTCLPQVDPLFDPTKSKSFKTLSCSSEFCRDLLGSCNSTCAYTYSYGDGSYTHGVLSSETARFSTSLGQAYLLDDMAFGCGLDNAGYFSGVDGVVGFGRGPLSLTSQLGSQLGWEFSYCLGDFGSTTNKSSSVFIGKDPSIDRSTFQFTPLIANQFNPTFYYVDLHSIRVGGHKLNIDPTIFAIDSLGNGGTIVDSGTTITNLPQLAYDAVANHFRRTVPYPVVQNTTAIGLDLCFDVTGIVAPTFPAVELSFKDAAWRLPMENVFIPLDVQDSSLSCLGMDVASHGSFGIIGNYQQQNFELVFDLEGSRLGFKEKKCAP